MAIVRIVASFKFFCLSQPTHNPRVPHKPNSVMRIDGTDVDIRADDLTVIEELGRGAYGVVEKVI